MSQILGGGLAGDATRRDEPEGGERRAERPQGGQPPGGCGGEELHHSQPGFDRHLQLGRRRRAGDDRYAVAAARIADALTQDLLLAPLEAGVIPLPHQLYALTRAMAEDQIRYLLADEVGLGKTIEAGLIFRELKIRGLVKRVLVVAPKGLVTQWV